MAGSRPASNLPSEDYVNVSTPAPATQQAALQINDEPYEGYGGPAPGRQRIGAIIGIATFIAIVAIVVIVTVLTIKPLEETPTAEPLIIEGSRKLDCLPKRRMYPSSGDKKQCQNKGCIYDLKNASDGSPACYYDTRNLKFKLVEEKKTDLGVDYKIENVQAKYTVLVQFHFLTENVFRFKLSKVLESGKNYEVPIKIKTVDYKAEHTNYEIQINNDENDFHFKIIRKANKEVIWDTSIGGLIFDKNFIQIATLLPSKNVYGFGENRHESFRHDLKFKSWPLFSRDQPPEWVAESSLYGVQPFYTCIEKDGSSHGVLLVNSNAMEYEFIPAPGLIYRTTGGVLDFYAFFGPGPENVIQQYTEFVGRPFMPPYWALGFQVSRYGYLDLDDMKQVLVRFKKYNIPLDVQVADIDHMDQRKIFTIDQEKWNGIDKYFEEITAQGMKTIILFDPFILVNDSTYLPFQRGKEKDVFIKWPKGYNNADYIYTNSSIMVGYCWPRGRVAYPDFFKKTTQDWWIDELLRHRKNLIFNGIWIDMNEPAVFDTNKETTGDYYFPDGNWTLKCPDSEYELVETKASYVHDKNNKLSDKTLCMAAVQGENDEYKHFDVHSLYGITHTIPSYEAAKQLDNKRALVITRSNFIGSGQYAGHWTGDNNSKWSHLLYSIIGMFEFNLFGMPYVGADICGFWDDATEEMCQRWSQLGAFYPFSRNHNGEKNVPQDPGAFSEQMALSTKKVLDIRYEILPFYYTLFYKAHIKGNTVIRPLFHEYPKDEKTYPIQEQFLVGPAILISPVLTEKTYEVNAYFPKDNWYSYYDGGLVKKSNGGTVSGEWHKVAAPLDFIPIHIRGGHIIPTQEPANNTVYSRRNAFGLIVALDWDGEAKGDLFYDDGETYKFENNNEYFYATFFARENSLKMNIEHNSYAGMNTARLNKIRLFIEASGPVKPTFVVNGNTLLSNLQVEFKGFEIILKNLNLPMNQPFEIKWYDYTVEQNTRIDCSVEDQYISKSACDCKKCVYDPLATGRKPKCYIPSGLGGYKIKSNAGDKYSLERADSFTLYGNEIEDLAVDVSYGKVDQMYDVARIKVYDNKSPRYEVPIKLNMGANANSRIRATVQSGSSANAAAFFEVKTQSGVTLLDNKNLEHGFIYSNQFIQIALNLGYKNVYGFGENSHSTYKHSFEYSNFWGLFARDQPPGDKELNLYGTQPFLMAVNEANGRAMGILILNSNAMEYGFLPPQVFSYRTLGGILDIYILEEETPEKLIQAYTSLIGKPYMPPYWSLGFQLCRYGYKSLDKLKAAVDRTVQAGIPLDVQYADIDHFENQLDFTYNQAFKDLPNYIRELNSTGIRFIIILDPAINSEVEKYDTYIRGTEKDIWIKWPNINNPQKDELKGNNIYMLGYVWPEGKAVFPDFFLDRTKEWWKNEIELHFKNNLQFDGLWIDMNEPANFDTNEMRPWNYPKDKPAWNLHCPVDNEFDNPPYLPLAAKPYGNKKRISDKTICMIGVQDGGKYKQYDVHNLYGWSQSEPTLNALRSVTNARGIVISRSTYVSSGKYAGHWLGDNTSKWKHLKHNLIGLMEFNLFGIPYIGADICGYFDDTTPELCERWMEVGAFNTFFRNHNGYDRIEQDPAALGDQVAFASKKATDIRYTLLPYLYTLFYKVNTEGGTVIRSLYHEFPAEKRAADIYEQFLWGSSLLISPVISPNTFVVFAYFPSARWFDYYNGKEIMETGRMHEIDAPLDHIPLHVRGGSILATQTTANNTRYSRLNSFGLIIAPNAQNSASGSLYWDGGEEINPDQTSSLINFNYNQNEIKNTVFKNKYKFLDTNTLDTIRLFGQKVRPSKVTANNQEKEFKYYADTAELKLVNLKLKIDEAFTIRIEQ